MSENGAVAWSVYRLDDGERHWFAGPDAATVLRHAREEYAVGEDDDSLESGVTCEIVSGPLTFTEEDSGDAEGVERVRALHTGLVGARVWQSLEPCRECGAVAPCRHNSRSPKVTADASAWARWGQQDAVGKPHPYNAVACLGSSVW
jgi:hypothetical protein